MDRMPAPVCFSSGFISSSNFPAVGMGACIEVTAERSARCSLPPHFEIQCACASRGACRLCQQR